MFRFLTCLVLVSFIYFSSAGSPSILPQAVATDTKAGGDQRIVGGTTADRGEYPYQGLLIIESSLICGCVLIESQWVLTAAQCTTDDDGVARLPSTLEVRFGIIDSISDSSLFSESRSVSNVYNHPDFARTPTYFTGDISLLQLISPISAALFISPISLPVAGIDLVDVDQTSCSITGWGRLSSDGQASQFLREATVPIVDNTVCTLQYSSGTAIQILSDHVCAGFSSGGVGTCSGDAGGPLACRSTSTGLWTLVGITSFRVEGQCAAPQLPSIFTRVPTYVSWISGITGIPVLEPSSGATGSTPSQFYALHVVLMILSYFCLNTF